MSTSILSPQEIEDLILVFHRESFTAAINKACEMGYQSGYRVARNNYGDYKEDRSINDCFCSIFAKHLDLDKRVSEMHATVDTLNKRLDKLADPESDAPIIEATPSPNTYQMHVIGSKLPWTSIDANEYRGFLISIQQGNRAIEIRRYDSGGELIEFVNYTNVGKNIWMPPKG